MPAPFDPTGRSRGAGTALQSAAQTRQGQGPPTYDFSSMETARYEAPKSFKDWGWTESPWAGSDPKKTRVNMPMALKLYEQYLDTHYQQQSGQAGMMNATTRAYQAQQQGYYRGEQFGETRRHNRRTEDIQQQRANTYDRWGGTRAAAGAADIDKDPPAIAAARKKLDKLLGLEFSGKRPEVADEVDRLTKLIERWDRQQMEQYGFSYDEPGSNVNRPIADVDTELAKPADPQGTGEPGALGKAFRKTPPGMLYDAMTAKQGRAVGPTDAETRRALSDPAAGTYYDRFENEDRLQQMMQQYTPEQIRNDPALKQEFWQLYQSVMGDEAGEPIRAGRGLSE